MRGRLKAAKALPSTQLLASMPQLRELVTEVCAPPADRGDHGAVTATLGGRCLEIEAGDAPTGAAAAAATGVAVAAATGTAVAAARGAAVAVATAQRWLP